MAYWYLAEETPCINTHTQTNTSRLACIAVKDLRKLMYIKPLERPSSWTYQLYITLFPKPLWSSSPPLDEHKQHSDITLRLRGQSVFFAVKSFWVCRPYLCKTIHVNDKYTFLYVVEWCCCTVYYVSLSVICIFISASAPFSSTG